MTKYIDKHTHHIATIGMAATERLNKSMYHNSNIMSSVIDSDPPTSAQPVGASSTNPKKNSTLARHQTAYNQLVIT